MLKPPYCPLTRAHGAGKRSLRSDTPAKGTVKPSLMIDKVEVAGLAYLNRQRIQ